MLRRALPPLVWLVLVIGGATGVWAVIRSAGQDVASTAEVPISTSGTSVHAVSPSPRVAATSREDRDEPEHRQRHRTATAPAPTTATPTSPASPSAVPGSVAPKPAPHPTTTRTSAPSPAAPASHPATAAPGEVRRRWQGPPGEVVAGCTGARIAFRGAQANPGWGVTVEARGPEEVEVVFSPGDDGRETHVRGRCSAGAPAYSVASDDQGG